MSSYSSNLNSSYGAFRLGSKRLTRKRKKSGSRHDPVVVLSYFVFFGVLISGFSSFGL